jgi:predicted phage terminase large subunit-like protein
MPDAPASIFGHLLAALSDDWASKARPEQLPPPGNWSIWVYLAGRGAGKTRAGAGWVHDLARDPIRIALVAATAADARSVMVEGDSGVLRTAPSYNRPTYESSRRRITWPSGAEATLFSAEEPDRLRGPQFHAAWCDELAAWERDQETWDMLQFGLRLGKHPRVFISTTPRPTKLLKSILARVGLDVAMTRGTTFDNRENLAPSFFSQIISRYEGTRLGRQELDAELLEDVEGALWSRSMIEQCRIDPGAIPVFVRVAIAVDPAVSTTERSDETGIIVAALGKDRLGYVLADHSGKYSPDGWAAKVNQLYKYHRVDRVIYEKNQGGDLVANTLKTVNPHMPLRPVHASRGKILRAEPVAALYEQNKVRHVGAFPQLEDQMCEFAAGSSGSPDRLDALVYALSNLIIEGRGGMGISAELLAAAARPPGIYSSPSWGSPRGSGPSWGVEDGGWNGQQKQDWTPVKQRWST